MRNNGKIDQRKDEQKRSVFCLLSLGIVVLIVLGLVKDLKRMEQGKKLGGKLEEDDKSLSGKRIPTIEFLPNVWVMDVTKDEIVAFEDGERIRHEVDASCDFVQGLDLQTGIADLVLTDGKVTRILPKNQVIHGTLHDYGDDHVTLENYGRFQVDPLCKGYRLFKEPKMMGVQDLNIGYDFVDYIVENDEICAMLFVREGDMQEIRVLIRTDHYEGMFHQKINVRGDQGFEVVYQGEDGIQRLFYEKGTRLHVDSNSPFLNGEEKRMKIIPATLSGSITVEGLKRDLGDPSYHGSLEIQLTREGLVLINSLPLEEYLCNVVPSEMPASYPMEALKAQAICARTYAWRFMMQAGYPSFGAHVDDSVRYQVYQNQEKQENATNAVRMTSGIILETKEGEPAKTYYYSTSCGRGSDEAAWGNKDGKEEYLKEKRICRGATELPDDCNMDFLRGEDQDDYECQEPWYRWEYHVESVSVEGVKVRLREVLDSKEEWKGFEKLLGLEITERGQSGIALCLEVETDCGTYYVHGENGIRKVLCDGNATIKRRDGMECTCTNLLPSAFFVLETSIQDGNVIEYDVTGGGLGHGIGMSQNAAKEMAREGMNAEEILRFFYEGCELSSIMSGETDKN